MLTHQVPIESQFIAGLVDHLNAEIVLGTVRWLRWAGWLQTPRTAGCWRLLFCFLAAVFYLLALTVLACRLWRYLPVLFCPTCACT
jgi:hypothetical protein